MKENIEPRKFVNQVEELYKRALEETIDLLKNNENGSYIAIPDWDDEVDTEDWNEIPISIWAIGLNNAEHICIKAGVMNVGYGYCEEDFPGDWVDITEREIAPSCYPELYRFVAENLGKATTKEEADKVEWDE